MGRLGKATRFMGFWKIGSLIPSTKENLSCKLSESRKTATWPGCHRRELVALGPFKRSWESRGLWYRFHSLSPGKQGEKRKYQPTSLPLDLHNIVSLKEMAWYTFLPNRWPVVSFRPFSQGQGHKDLPTRLWKRGQASREQLLGRQPVVSVAEAVGLFLWFISLKEAKPHIWRHFRSCNLPSWDHGYCWCPSSRESNSILKFCCDSPKNIS